MFIFINEEHDLPNFIHYLELNGVKILYKSVNRLFIKTELTNDQVNELIENYTYQEYQIKNNEYYIILNETYSHKFMIEDYKLEFPEPHSKLFIHLETPGYYGTFNIVDIISKTLTMENSYDFEIDIELFKQKKIFQVSSSVLMSNVYLYTMNYL